MHRSGTSVIARGLEVCGVRLGNNLMPPDAGQNPKGFFEDLDICSLNEEMLTVLGRNWHDIVPIQPNEFERLYQADFFHRAVELLKKKSHNVPVFGFKDPRIARLLPFWKRVFDERYNVSYVITLRNPFNVVNSLQKRNDFEREKSYFLWLEHVLSSFIYTENCNRIIIDYDDILNDAENELRILAHKLNLTIDPLALGTYITEFLDDNLRHSAGSSEDLLKDPACPSIVHGVYRLLFDICKEKERLDLKETGLKLKQFYAELGKIVPLLHLTENLREKKIEFSNQLIDLRQTLKERELHISALQESVEYLKQTMAEKDQTISVLQQEINNRDNIIISLQDEQKSFQDAIDSILNSTCWKLTSPLRSLAAIGRKFHGGNRG